MGNRSEADIRKMVSGLNGLNDTLIGLKEEVEELRHTYCLLKDTLVRAEDEVRTMAMRLGSLLGE